MDEGVESMRLNKADDPCEGRERLIDSTLQLIEKTNKICFLPVGSGRAWLNRFRVKKKFTYVSLTANLGNAIKIIN